MDVSSLINYISGAEDLSECERSVWSYLIEAREWRYVPMISGAFICRGYRCKNISLLQEVDKQASIDHMDIHHYLCLCSDLPERPTYQAPINTSLFEKMTINLNKILDHTQKSDWFRAAVSSDVDMSEKLKMLADGIQKDSMLTSLQLD